MKYSYQESYIEKIFKNCYERFKNPPNKENEFIGCDPKFFLEQEYPVKINNKTYFIDFYEPSCRIAIELDGYFFHEKTQKQVEKDTKRQNDLIEHGYKVLRFTGSQVRTNSIQVLSDIYKLYCKLSVTNG